MDSVFAVGFISVFEVGITDDKSDVVDEFRTFKPTNKKSKIDSYLFIRIFLLEG